MFDIGWSELLVVAVVAIIFVGPKDLIPMLRTAGQQIGKLKRMASEFQGQFNEALREAELDSVKRDVEKAVSFDPLRSIKADVDKELKDIQSSDRKPAASEQKSDKPAAIDKPAAEAAASSGETQARKPAKPRKPRKKKTPADPAKAAGTAHDTDTDAAS